MWKGVAAGITSGVGVLVAADPVPLVVVSRNIVPVSLCDVWITVGNCSLPGRVLYLGIFAVLTINKILPQVSNFLPISTNEYKVGDRLDLFAVDPSQQLVQVVAEIREIGPLGTVPTVIPPRWHVTNFEALFMLGAPTNNDGVLIDPEDKAVIAIWMAIDGAHVGLDYNRYVRPIVEDLQNPKENYNRCCGWEFGSMMLPDAVNLGLSDERVARISDLVSRIRLVPRSIYVTGKLRPVAQETLKVGDIILEVNGKAVVRMADMYTLSRTESAELLILRGRNEMSVQLDTESVPSALLNRIIFWVGGVFHETHATALEQITPEFESIAKREGVSNIWESVYIASVIPGSPADGGGFGPGCWLLEIDDHHVRAMDDMLGIISLLKGRVEYVRLKMLTRIGTISMVGVRPNSKFWPPWLLEWKDMRWVRTELV
jgi:pro-apoptotic serine protease NMA111